MTRDRQGLAAWCPPSPTLHFRDGMWQPANVREVSYPSDGNDAYAAVEDSSYWFQYRNAILLSVVRNYPPAGDLYDIGGGNGVVTACLERRGHSVVLLEPGSGAMNARRRGVTRIIRSTLEDAGFPAASLPAAGAFDVVEHVDDDIGFLKSLRRSLTPRGRFYCTVPALSSLWSAEDAHAGHFRRYSRRSLGALLQSAGFDVEFISYFFAWLVPPIYLLRALPFRVNGRTDRVPSQLSIRRAHSMPAWLHAVITPATGAERFIVANNRSIPFGSSLVCVARRP